MKKIVLMMLFALTVIQLNPYVLVAQSDDLYSFEVEEFSKKTWEMKNIISLTASSKFLNQDSLLYAYKFSNQDESKITEWTLQLTMDNRWDWDWSRLYLIGEALFTSSSIEGADENSKFLREGYWQISVFDPHSIEVGKRLLRWGKGYAFNPVALMERPKNPSDPEANREGLWITQAVLIPPAMGMLDANSISLVYLPVRSDVNLDYQENLDFENIWGLKLYALSGTTDFDLYLTRWSENAETDWGLDFASNLSSNFEIHGEYSVDSETTEKYKRSLLGIRYLTESDVTWTIEGFHDDTGWSKEESETIYQTIKTGSTLAAKTAISELQSKQNVNQNYAYVKASVKEPFDWLYFTLSVAILNNLDDMSQNSITQFNYTPIDNWAFLLAWQKMQGDSNTQYGESLVENKIDLKGTYSF